ncbi:MAG: EVE domain-containing protein [Candidatus Eremiobacteraeota bacterium]|nr:EVE domain-containing protein [Candidatus Eremiobacteraeota bacterium]
MRYWLFKSEPDSYGLDALKRDRVTPWSGVRSYQARNNMLEMKLGDRGFFYHSSTAQPGAVAVCEVVREAYPDFTAFERGGDYYDPRSKREKPIWQMVDVKYIRTLKHPVLLSQMRAEPRLVGMELLKKGSRLSVQTVMPHEWKIVLEMSEKPAL